MATFRPLLCIVGPTASGKGAAAFALAQWWQTEIVTADSRQLYRGMAIGTDQPPPSWLRRVPHHCVGMLSPHDSFSAGRFCRTVEPVLDRLYSRHRLPIVVGGTGLYVRALLYGLIPAPPADAAIRRRLQRLHHLRGPEVLHAWLRRVDEESAAVIAPADGQKLIRALEIYLLTGRARASWHAAHAAQRSESARYDHLVVGLHLPRRLLYQRIEARVAEMVKNGLVSEVEQLWTAGCDEHHPAMRGLGYRQLVHAFQGRCSVEDAIERTVLDTRRYAKRQLTWFRHQPGVAWLELDGAETPEIVAARIVEMCRSRWASARHCAIMAAIFSEHDVNTMAHALSTEA